MHHFDLEMNCRGNMYCVIRPNGLRACTFVFKFAFSRNLSRAMGNIAVKWGAMAQEWRIPAGDELRRLLSRGVFGFVLVG